MTVTAETRRKPRKQRHTTDPDAASVHTQEGPGLESLAATVNREHAAGDKAARKGIGHYRAAGKALLEAKKLLAHGEWLPWLKAHCPAVTERRAQRYMKLAETDVTSDLEDAWRVICGNAPAADAPKAPVGPRPPAEDADEPELEPDGSWRWQTHLRSLDRETAERVLADVNVLRAAWGGDPTDVVLKAIFEARDRLPKEGTTDAS